MNEGKKRQDTEAARRIQLLEESVELSQAFEAVRSAYIQAWADTKPHEELEREKYWSAVQVVDRVRSHLTRVVGNGELAKRDLELAERKRRR